MLIKRNLYVVGMALSVMMVSACQSTVPQLPPEVQLNQGVYTIPETGVYINQAGGLQLKPGQYTFVVKKDGHRDKVHAVEVRTGKGRFLQLAPGPGYATGRIDVKPESALLAFNEQELIGGFQGELEAGQYPLNVSADGYLAAQQQITVQAGQPFAVNIALDKIPQEAAMTIRTQPEGGKVSIEPHRQSPSPLHLESMPFGVYQASAIHMLSDNERLTGTKTITFNRNEAHDFTIPLHTKELRFQGNWYPEEQALDLAKQHYHGLKQQEQQAYQAVRVAKPIDVVFHISENLDKQTMSSHEFAKALFALLRVGDRVIIHQADQSYQLWKRTTELGQGTTQFIEHWPEQVGASFQQQVDVFWQQRPAQVFFNNQRNATQLKLSQGSSLITTLAYRLYRRLNQYALLDIDESIHSLDAISVHTTESDGAVTLVSIGGYGIRVNDQEVAVTSLIGLKKITPATQQLQIRWDEAPQKLLIVSEHQIHPQLQVATTELKRNQKQLVALLTDDMPVVSLQRFTRYPDGSWQSRNLGTSDGLAMAINLNVDEIGPHDTSGQYQRHWLVTFKENGNKRQRHLSLHFAVGEAQKQVESDYFFRRQQALRE